MLRSVPLSDGDVVRVDVVDGTGPSWTFRRTRSGGGARGTVDRFEDDEGGSGVLPYPEGSGLFGFLPSRPSVPAT